jgi:hypothetical protein
MAGRVLSTASIHHLACLLDAVDLLSIRCQSSEHRNQLFSPLYRDVRYPTSHAEPVCSFARSLVGGFEKQRRHATPSHPSTEDSCAVRKRRSCGSQHIPALS